MCVVEAVVWSIVAGLMLVTEKIDSNAMFIGMSIIVAAEMLYGRGG